MNFKKYIAPAVLVAFGLLGCAASHPASVAVASPPPPPAVVAVAPTPVAPAPAPAPEAAPVVPTTPADPLLASGDGWSFKVVDADWELVDKNNLEAPALAIAVNSELAARLMLFSHRYPGNQTAFTTMIIKGATQNKAKVSKLNTVSINDNDFSHASIVDGKLHVQIWMLVKNGNGYAFMCGAQNTNPKVSDACTQMVNTLHID